MINSFINRFTTGSSKGFTLIELLVVIAIIGILAGIVLASLSNARNSGTGAKIKEELSSLRTAAEIYYGANVNRYQTTGVAIATCAGGAFSDTASGASALLSSVQNADTATDCGINAAGSAWSVASTLPDGTFWCVDSTGASKSTQAGGTTAYTALTGAATAAHTAVGSTACN